MEETQGITAYPTPDQRAEEVHEQSSSSGPGWRPASRASRDDTMAKEAEAHEAGSVPGEVARHSNMADRFDQALDRLASRLAPVLTDSSTVLADSIRQSPRSPVAEQLMTSNDRISQHLSRLTDLTDRIDL